MPKENIFSGKYEPDRDTCTEANEDNVARFRTAMLKLDRIHNESNEQDITENIMQLCSRNNKTGEKIDLSVSYEFEDAMDWLERVYNDVDADLMIIAIDELAKRYGYTADMDESIEIVQEKRLHATESFPALINRIQTTYATVPASEQKILTHKIAGGMKLYELESNARPKVHRGEIWAVEVSTGVGRETTGIRWSLIISNTTHAKVSDAVNVVYLDGEEPKNLMSQMKINNTDLEFGTLTKQPSRINLTDLYTVDRKRFRDCKGKVTSAFMQKVMTRIASQIGITLDSGSTIEDID